MLEISISTFVLVTIKIERKLQGTDTSVTVQTAQQCLQMIPRKRSCVSTAVQMLFLKL